MSETRRKVRASYFYDQEIGNFCLGGGNPMRPHRARLTHNLVNHYGLFDKLHVHRPRKQTYEDMTVFHADEYIDFLRTVTPDNQEEFMAQLRRFNLGAPGEADCPVFDGMYDYFQIYAGGSVDAACLVNDGTVDLAFNWMGGMHHAKRAEASGFCYINDIVLAILELLKTHQRVLYVDIDIHHGDGVEEAFYLTDRVMTVSFHKYGDFFPGTGALGDIGADGGRYYSVNGPLLEGVDDESYHMVFQPVMQKVMDTYQPGAVVVCGGADSLSGDRLGCFNLSIEGHSKAVEFLQSFGVPIIMLGGGGYTMRNVARCWTYETGSMIGQELPDELPEAALSQYNYYMDTGKLRIQTSNMKNANTREYLEKLRVEMLKNLSKMPAAPSVQLARQPEPLKPEEPDEDDPDVRGGGQGAADRRVVKDGYESDEEKGARAQYDPKADPAYTGPQRPADLADRAQEQQAGAAAAAEGAAVAAGARAAEAAGAAVAAAAEGAAKAEPAAAEGAAKEQAPPAEAPAPEAAAPAPEAGGEAQVAKEEGAAPGPQ
ncbi:unnamed protein product [Pedinophyceae sp. YPF-701]|nr:unnamed protein product [Pedinophyceae sp. YPF-701]